MERLAPPHHRLPDTSNMKPTLVAVLATMLTGCGSQVAEPPVVITNAISMYSNTAHVPQPFLGGQIASNYYYQGIWSGILIGYTAAKDRVEGSITNDDIGIAIETRVRQHMATNETLQRVREIYPQ